MLRILLLCLAVLAAAPSAAGAATADIADPGGDVPSGGPDLVGLRVDWDGGLTVALTFRELPDPLVLQVVISEASRDESDPRVGGCDAEREAALLLEANGPDAVLRYGRYREHELRTTIERDGPTVRYRFAAPELEQDVAIYDPFACAEATAGEDGADGAFAGKVLKLTSPTARDGLTAELARRYAGAFTSDAERSVRCPRRLVSPALGGLGAGATCAFRFGFGRRYRMGRAVVKLDTGVVAVTGLRSRTFPVALRHCGLYDFRKGWRAPPVTGFVLEAWAQGVPCTTARRVAGRWYRDRDTLGFACRRTVGGFASRVRCTRPGGGVVRVEANAY